MTLNELSAQVLDAAIEVHRSIGPGLLEKTNQICLARELELRSISVQREVPLSLNYKGLSVTNAYRLDLLIENCLVVEIKVAEANNDVFKAQTLTYLRIGDYKLGLLINFGLPRLIDGYVRIANGL